MIFKKKFKTLMIVLSVLMMITCASAQTPSQLLSDRFASFNTFEADFNQSVKDKNGNILQKSEGKAALVRPELFRWETLSPNQQLIIADGKNIWIDDKDLQQVTKQKQHSARHTPGLLLSEPVNQIVSQFTITELQNNVFQLVPKGQQDLFQSVTLSFQDNLLKSMTIQDNLGQLTTIQFTHTRINQNLSKNLFVFVVPKNSDVVEN